MILGMLRLIRPYYTAPFSCGLIVIAAYIVGGDFVRLDAGLLRGCVSLFLVLSAGYMLNDVCDIAVDSINDPNKPLPCGQVSRRAAMIFSGVLLAGGLSLAVFAGARFFFVLFMVALGLAVYDLYSKRMGIFKDFVAAVLMTSLYPLAFTLAEPVETARLKALYIFPVWLFLTAFGYEMLKDIRDVKGDRMVKNTKSSLCSKPAFGVAAKAILLTAALLTVLPFLLGYCRIIYAVSALMSLVLVVLSLPKPPARTIPFIYAEVALITAGSLADLLVYGP